MASPEPPALSADAQAVLSLLRDQHNVLLSGPPAAGKTRLLAEVRRGFEWTPGPAYIPSLRIPLPSDFSGSAAWLPSPRRTDRKVFQTVFDQSTKVRDVLRGVVPIVSSDRTANSPALRFTVSRGTLFRAAEHALTESGAALMIVDEINRGPAVAAFGPSLVALETDKRLDENGTPTSETQTFELLDDDGEIVDYALPTHLYLLGAMNQADTSVEPLDVAFLRRFAPYRLSPSESILRSHFGVAPKPPDSLPASAESAEDVYQAAVLAWRAVNDRIGLGRGMVYQLGHGVFMRGTAPTGLQEALEHVRQGWSSIRQHVDEVFFGDTRGVAAVLSADKPASPYSLMETTFAGQPVVQLHGPQELSDDQLYRVLRVIAQT